MDIHLEKNNSTEASIKITLNEADYQPKVEEKLKEHSKKANIKGFRPGKVPPSLLKKMYGKSILIDEINQLLSHSVTDYIKDNNLQILGEPLPNTEHAEKIDWDNQKEYSFTYNIGLVDDFSYNLSPEVKVDQYQIELDDKSLNETLDNLRKQFGKMSNPEVSEDGDSLYGDLKKTEGAFEELPVLLSIDDVEKEYQDKFIGAKKDDTIEFDLLAAVKEENLEKVLGKDPKQVGDLNGNFSFTVKNINRSELADFDQELFDKIFGKDAVSNEEEFRQKVKDTISENYNREAEQYLVKTIQDKLVDSTVINTPDEFLKRWLLATNEGKLNKEDIDKEYSLYLKELKWNLLQNKIGEENNIKVENEDVIEKAKNLIRMQLASSGMAGQLEDNLDTFADNFLKSEKGDNYMKLYNEVKSEKTLAFIKEKISIDQKKVDVEQFKQIALN